jgi:uncharacterized protein
MTRATPALYVGKVVHRRLRPVLHELSYDVASVYVDVDRMDDLPRLLRYNGFGLFGLFDRDFGPLDATQSLAAYAWREMRKRDPNQTVRHIMLLCYPRMLGYAFNPLSVFYGLDDAGQIHLILYEVHNTFGGRHVYVAGPFLDGEAAASSAEKTFRVSPFNQVEGHYCLKASTPGENVAVGVALRTGEGPVLNAYFTAERRPLTNAGLLRVFITIPLMTFKVMAGIHWEALKLWAKGLKLQSP